MRPFAFVRAGTFDEALAAAADRRFRLPVLKAGGIDVLDHLKEGLIDPDLLVCLRRARSAPDAPPVTASGTTLRIEATATLAQVGASPEVRRLAPAVAQAVESAASPQVRHAATAAGNLLQRPRCWYYRHAQFHCLKKGGPTCFAVEGENRYHAVFGGGPCHIVHPSNLALALAVCDGVAHVAGAGRDAVPIAELYHLPATDVRSEHTLRPGEVVTHLTARARERSGFYAVKEKQSFDWPLAAAAAALELDGAVVRSARVFAGAVAPVPWPLPAVEEALRGVSLDDGAALRGACEHATAGAQAMSDNAFKLKLLPVAVRRAVLVAAGRGEEAHR